MAIVFKFNIANHDGLGKPGDPSRHSSCWAGVWWTLHPSVRLTAKPLHMQAGAHAPHRQLHRRLCGGRGGASAERTRHPGHLRAVRRVEFADAGARRPSPQVPAVRCQAPCRKLWQEMSCATCRALHVAESIADAPGAALLYSFAHSSACRPLTNMAWHMLLVSCMRSNLAPHPANLWSPHLQRTHSGGVAAVPPAVKAAGSAGSLVASPAEGSAPTISCASASSSKTSGAPIGRRSADSLSGNPISHLYQQVAALPHQPPETTFCTVGIEREEGAEGARRGGQRGGGAL